MGSSAARRVGGISQCLESGHPDWDGIVAEQCSTWFSVVVVELHIVNVIRVKCMCVNCLMAD